MGKSKPESKSWLEAELLAVVQRNLCLRIDLIWLKPSNRFEKPRRNVQQEIVDSIPG